MSADRAAVRRSSLDEWLQAIRGISGNPVAHYVKLSQQRARGKLNVFRRNAPLLISMLLVLPLTVIYLVDNPYSSALDEEMRYFIYALVGIWWVIVFLQGLYDAVRSAVTALSRPAKIADRMPLDDMLATSSLTDVEIAAGLLHGILPTVWRRTAGGYIAALAITMFEMLLAFIEHGMVIPSGPGGSGDEFWFLVIAPLAAILLTVSSCLSVTILIMFYFINGRDTTSRMTASVSSFMAVLGQVVWLPFAIGSAMVSAIYIETSSYGDGLEFGSLLAVASMALVFLMVLQTLNVAGRSGLMRNVVLVFGPMTFPGILFIVSGCVIGFFAAMASLMYNSGEIIQLFLANYIWSLGAAAPVNLGAMPTALLLFLFEDMTIDFFNFFELLRPLVFIAFQVLLLMLMGKRTVHAVQSRRQANIE